MAAFTTPTTTPPPATADVSRATAVPPHKRPRRAAQATSHRPKRNFRRQLEALSDALRDFPQRTSGLLKGKNCKDVAAGRNRIERSKQVALGRHKRPGSLGRVVAVDAAAAAVVVAVAAAVAVAAPAIASTTAAAAVVIVAAAAAFVDLFAAVALAAVAAAIAAVAQTGASNP